jgi:hypothetical protein
VLERANQRAVLTVVPRVHWSLVGGVLLLSAASTIVGVSPARAAEECATKPRPVARGWATIPGPGDDAGPYATAPTDGELLRRMGRTQRRPPFYDWYTQWDRTPNRLLQLYRLSWHDLPDNVRVLAPWTPNAELWGKAQQQWLQGAVECPCDGGPGGGPFSAGWVPDGAQGTPLLVGKNATIPSQLDLSWGSSCSSDANDYSVHQGAVGNWYSHDRLVCTTGGVPAETIAPGGGDRYFLIVPINVDVEGGYGLDSASGVRPVSGTRCRTSSLTNCS